MVKTLRWLRPPWLAGVCAGLLLITWNNTAAAQEPKEHSELDATVAAPFHAARGERATQARAFVVRLAYPGEGRTHAVRWTLTLSGPGPQGAVLRRWSGTQQVGAGGKSVTLPWDGRADADAPKRRGLAPDGLYQLRLLAVADAGTPQETQVEQQWPIQVRRRSGTAPTVPAFQAGLQQLPSLEGQPGYRIVYANLHSQTRHSDGGAALDACHGAQDPQTAPFGPIDAYKYAQQHGLDALLTSEHNHMYDGSDGTNPAATAAEATVLYQTGLAEAAAYSAAHPGFLALYGMEWGVINKGGHVNILNSEQLLGWERNALGELLADVETPKGDYAGLYALMRERGWVGQFNHPAQTGQFLVNGQPLGYTPDGDAAMVLCEVMNTSAFSTNDQETETRRSNYEAACNRALSAGYHLAFSSNQDNHCANWGASYGNRTAVLVTSPVAGTPVSRDSFLEALRARRVFATMDKHAQLLFTASGKLMGERFDNHGPLHLATHFSNSAGRQAAAIAIFHGVPGSNGSVTQVSDQAELTLTPAPGPHFYYARLVQDDGNIVWSAPVWVNQLP
ncbi:CehA/McbA family metallohydrolase [Janthinobacterium lividum]|uniref:CehA/McbA family metallohydrolase n=1 Tax=Janthinobacterium lividum TaxID=29581 RepID=A0ABU0XST3_9BURK|nr:CehA/McbA family metallohydrolase [Janthinobacterium lividum]MDQ4625506.1 CehA/McbA family metallohydrolase [Janthinobacterium lividum]MDQ4672891.1 CehA/McbA family metallohydrolase [Janthinobacterium lividum]MDQ4683619.1 CehA/McbA family metallohydrolase [Janthinobacterium lividum]